MVPGVYQVADSVYLAYGYATTRGCQPADHTVLHQLQLPDGWYLSSSPITTSNWEGDSGNKWTLPWGRGFGKIVRFGKLPVNLTAQAYYNSERPEPGANWQLQLVATFLFPK